MKLDKKSPGLIDAFRFVGNGLGSMANYLGNKYQEYDMNNKILEGGAATLKGLAIAGKFLYKVAKPVVKYTSIRTVQGIGYLCQQAEFHLSDDEKDDDDEEEEDEKDKKDKKDKKNKKDKKKKKKNKKKIENENSNTINNNNNQNSKNNSIINNNQGSSLCLKEGQYEFQPVPDYPTFESINKIEFNNNNDLNQNNNRNNNNNINNNINSNTQNPMNNNQVVKPDFVIPPGLEASAFENSIVGEK